MVARGHPPPPPPPPRPPPLADGLARLGNIPQMRDGQPAIAEARRAFAAVQELRARVDADLAKSAAERRAEVVAGLVPAITGLIEKTNQLRLTLETLTRPPAAQLVQLITLRHLAAEMAEYAGRERARLAAIVGTRQKMSDQDFRILATGRGHIELAWNSIAVLRVRPDAPKPLVAAVDAVEKSYFGDYETLRQAVLGAGATGDYPVDGKQYFDRVTTGINTVLALAQEMGAVAERATLAEAGDSTSRVVEAGLILLAGLLLAAVSFWVAFARIVRPIAGMTAAMERLAGGDKSVEISGATRGDEIGAMARTVQVFKDNAIAMEKMQAEQEEMKHHAEVEKKRALAKLADDFEASVSGVVGAVESAAGAMQSTAQSMSATAEQTSRQALAVGSASERASANVQTVASAAEELTSSISEISRQVSQASAIAGKAAEDGKRTDATVGRLADTAQKIGEVIKLIQDIAGQTNLLALNATIEAARAGEAGKGFAVVAGEVKHLASQTAKATDDIRLQITAIQEETHTAVEAIRGICQVIQDINGISSSIASAVEEQGAATQEIARNVQQAAEGTGEVTQNIGGVTSAASETGTAATDVLTSASELARQSESLRREVDKFLATIRAA